MVVDLKEAEGIVLKTTLISFWIFFTYTQEKRDCSPVVGAEDERRKIFLRVMCGRQPGGKIERTKWGLCKTKAGRKIII